MNDHQTVYEYHLEEEVSRSSTTLYEKGWRAPVDSDDELEREPVIGKLGVSRSYLPIFERDLHITSYVHDAWKEQHGDTKTMPFLEPLHIVSSVDASCRLYFKSPAEDIIALQVLLESDEFSFTLERKLRIVQQLCDAFDFLHRIHVAHRFLTCESVLVGLETGQIWVDEFEYGTTSDSLSYDTHDSPLEQLEDENFPVELLAYLSPEIVSKSFERAVDHRTDIYEIGILMYRIFSGCLPFIGPPMKVLHAIQAVKPPPMCGSTEAPIPKCVVRMIDRLLQKDPDARYQTAYGLKMDVTRCLAEVEAYSDVKETDQERWSQLVDAIDFPLASCDTSPIPKMPQTLYGREESIQRATSLIDSVTTRARRQSYPHTDLSATLPFSDGSERPTPRIVNGGCEFLIVSGSAGMGKTAFVMEVMNRCRNRFSGAAGQELNGTETESAKEEQNEFAGRQGASSGAPGVLFARGKFDFLSERGNPYSGLVTCLRTVVFQLLSQTKMEEDRKRFRERIRPNEKLLLNLIPETALLFGLQNDGDGDSVQDLEQVDPKESRARFLNVLIAFLSAIAEKQALVLFLDDVQWACQATFDLLESLASTFAKGPLSNVVIVLAYRNDEDHHNWPRIRWLVSILKTRRSSGVVSIDMGPLSLNAVHDLLCYVIGCDAEEEEKDNALWELARVLSRKTRSNPFFLIQILGHLVRDQAVFYDWDTHRWAWKLEAIEETNLTDNVISFLVNQIADLPREAKHVLIVGACCGQQFAVEVVQHCVSEILLPPGSDLDVKTYVAKGLAIAQAEGLVKPGVGEDEYVFTHDHIYQAADTLADDETKAKIYLCHMNPFITSITDPDERARLRNINKIAIMRSKETGDLASAARYADAGLRLFGMSDGDDVDGDIEWPEDIKVVDEMIFFHLAKGECSFATSCMERVDGFESAVGFVEKVIKYASTPLLRAKAYIFKVRMLNSQGRIDQAIHSGIIGRTDIAIALYTHNLTIGLECLQDLGIPVRMPISNADRDEAVNRCHRILESLDVDELVNIKRLEDESIAAVVEIITSLADVVYFVDRNLHAWLLSKAVLLSFQHGISAVSLGGMTTFAGIYMAELSAPVTFRLGCAMSARCRLFKVNAVTTKVFVPHGSMIVYLGEHMNGAKPFLKEAYTAASLVGHTWWQSHSLMLLSIVEHLSAEDLLVVQRNTHQRLHLIEAGKWWEDGAVMLTGLYRYIKALREPTHSPARLFDDVEDLNGPRFVEKDYLRSVQKGSNPGRMSVYEWFKCMALYTLGHPLMALTHAELCWEHLQHIPPGPLFLPVMHFYHCLCLLELARVLKSGGNAKELNEIPGHLRHYEHCMARLHEVNAKVQGFAKRAEINCKHLGLIIQAELQGLEGRMEEALQLHQGAMDSAVEHGFRQHEALSYELQAQLLLRKGLRHLAIPQLRAAADKYRDWGADRKAHAVHAFMKSLIPTRRFFPSASYAFSRAKSFVLEQGMLGNHAPHSLEAVTEEASATGTGSVTSSRRTTSASINSRASTHSAAWSFAGTNSSSSTGSNSLPVGLYNTYALTETHHPSHDFTDPDEPGISYMPITTLNSYDLSSVIVAIQMLSSEIDFKKLVPKMMTLIAENSGATKGALVLEDHDKKHLIVESRFDVDATSTPEADDGRRAAAARTASSSEETLDTSGRKKFVAETLKGTAATRLTRRVLSEVANDFSERIIRYVARTKQPLILADASHDLLTADDPYIMRTGVKSVLCLPMFSRDRDGLVGVLYLENVVMAGAFSGKSVQVLSLLCSQVAISVEHSILFRNLQAAKRAAEESDKQNKVILECMPQLVWTLNKQGEITFANKKWTEYTGKSTEAVLGSGWVSMLHPDDVKATLEVWRYSQSRSPDSSCFYSEYRLRASDGSYKWFLARATPFAITNEDGVETVEMWLGTSTDIQDQKEAKEWKRIERELRETREAALNNAKLKSQFLANMSHELRTPFSGVLGMINLLAETVLTEEQVEYVFTAKQSCENLLFVIDGILDYSKLEAGMVRQEKIPADLELVTEQTCDLLVTLAGDKGIELYSFPTGPVPMVEADPHLIRQVLLNLVGNAIKFTHQGEVHIKFGVEEDDGETVLIKFEVEDTGIGLSEHELKVLYKPFSQVDGSTTRIYGGTGLGLSICKSIADIMGGQVGVTSLKGKGSNFWFTARLRKIGDLDGSVSPAAPCAPPSAFPAPSSLAPGLYRAQHIPTIQSTPPFTTSPLPPDVKVLLVADNPWKATALSHFRQILPNELVTMDLETFTRELSDASLQSTYGLIIIDQNDIVRLQEALGVLVSGALALVLITPKMAKALTTWKDSLKSGGIEVVKLTKPLTRGKLLRSLAELTGGSKEKNGHGSSRASTTAGTPSSVASKQPVGTSAASIDTVSLKLAAPPQAPRHFRKIPHILIAEDNHIAAKVAIKTIEKLAVPKEQIIYCKDGQEAIDTIVQFWDTGTPKVDLILMDLHMPRKDGFEATREIRRLETERERVQVPILGLTADIQASAREACLANGMNDYLVKPCSKENLAAAIVKWVERGGHERDSSSLVVDIGIRSWPEI
ncbi:hypothetical protein HDU85_006824 [Gaertneriomyces sp. JEL0708]|nr:hypothetical protein HDU85_006824 [Gaertneriomyces sp. JEL0708]